MAIELGGLAERDYRREDAVSYNPRPARLVHILLSDCGNSSEAVLAAAMIASVCEARQATYPPSIPEEVQRLVAAAGKPLDELYAANDDAKQIAVSIRLDRARHFHLSKPNLDQFSSFISDTKQYIPLADQCSAKVSTLLRAWIKRAERQLGQAHVTK